MAGPNKGSTAQTSTSAQANTSADNKGQDTTSQSDKSGLNGAAQGGVGDGRGDGINLPPAPPPAADASANAVADGKGIYSALPPAAATERPLMPALRVRSCSPMGTFRRAGFRFSAEPEVLFLEQLSEEQIKAIKAEPMLIVDEVEAPPPFWLN